MGELTELVLGKLESEDRLLDYNDSGFSSTKEIRAYILDNREDYDGYVVRSHNNWDSDVVYIWRELNDGKIVWRKN